MRLVQHEVAGSIRNGRGRQTEDANLHVILVGGSDQNGGPSGNSPSAVLMDVKLNLCTQRLQRLL